jgi:hypothetical protein
MGDNRIGIHRKDDVKGGDGYKSLSKNSCLRCIYKWSKYTQMGEGKCAPGI